MRQAYVTLLSGNDRYLPGAEALAVSLQRTGTQQPMVALITPDVDPRTVRALQVQGWDPLPVEPIHNPNPATQQLFHRFDSVYTKLQLWALDFDKVVYLDADTLVIQSIDSLFDRPDFAAAPDFFLPDHFNSGVMVIRPDREVFERMVAALPNSSSYDGGDQGFLNTFLSDWWTGPPEGRLPCGYNFHNFIYQFLNSNPALMSQILPDLYVIHYTLQKPWLNAVSVAGGTELWWDAYYQAHPEDHTGIKDRIHRASDRAFEGFARILTR